jgi:hypothetical protein
MKNDKNSMGAKGKTAMCPALDTTTYDCVHPAFYNYLLIKNPEYPSILTILV